MLTSFGNFCVMPRCASSTSDFLSFFLKGDTSLHFTLPLFFMIVSYAHPLDGVLQRLINVTNIISLKETNFMHIITHAKHHRLSFFCSIHLFQPPTLKAHLPRLSLTFYALKPSRICYEWFGIFCCYSW